MHGEAEPEPLATTAAGADGTFSLTVPAGEGRPAPFLEWDGLETPWVETGADGSFRLEGLPPRRRTVVELP